MCSYNRRTKRSVTIRVKEHIADVKHRRVKKSAVGNMNVMDKPTNVRDLKSERKNSFIVY